MFDVSADATCEISDFFEMLVTKGNIANPFNLFKCIKFRIYKSNGTLKDSSSFINL